MIGRPRSFLGWHDITLRTNNAFRTPETGEVTGQNDWEFRELLRLYKRLAPRNALEIGVYRGGSFREFLRHSTPGARVLGVDLTAPLPEDLPAFTQGWEIPQGVEYHLIRGNSGDRRTLSAVKSWLSGSKLDFLFLDGGHEYEEVLTDFEFYGPLVRSGGLIAIHDIEDHAGVRAFWRDLVRRGYVTQELSHMTGGIPEDSISGTGLIYQGASLV
jgi:cephalosporin hydroxylase